MSRRSIDGNALYIDLQSYRKRKEEGMKKHNRQQAHMKHIPLVKNDVAKERQIV